MGIFTRKTKCSDEKEYSNERYKEYEIEFEKMSNDSVCRFKSGENLSSCVTRISIMLSNMCNYSNIHPKCPANCIKNKEVLRLEYVNDVLDDLSEIDYCGTIAFHIYNEPMMDPRLFYIMSCVKEKCKSAKTLIYTNGFYITQDMINDLEEYADVIVMTGYGLSEFNRLKSYRYTSAFKIILGNLDDRLDLYNNTDSVKSNDACRALISDFSIYSNGDVGLCCLDYLHPYGLGNIKEKRLREIVDSYEIRRIQEELLSGNRERYSICSNCTWSR